MNIARSPELVYAYRYGSSAGSTSMCDIYNTTSPERFLRVDKGIRIETTETDIRIDATTFPDEVFRNYVRNNFDTNNDGYLSSDERAAVTEIYASNYAMGNQDISTFKGVEYFPNLLEFDCILQPVSSLDLSKNTKLQKLFTYGCGLTSLNISGCKSLTHVEVDGDASYNQLNYLTSLDLSDNDKLVTLKCNGNTLTSLNLSGCSSLEKLYCNDNALATLDISDCTALQIVECQNNALTALDISSCFDLYELYCNGNRLTTLDVTQTPRLNEVVDFPNATLSMGTYTVYTGTVFKKLSRLRVDNGVTLVSVGIDVELVGIPIDEEHFPDPNFRTYILSCGVDTNSDGYLSEEELRQATTLEPSNKGISSLKGIEYFGALRKLDCGTNTLSELDVSKNTYLKTLFCDENDLTELDVSHNTALETLAVSENQLSEINVSNNRLLMELHVTKNSLTSLNIRYNTNLTYLVAYGNRLTELNISGTPLLLDVYQNGVSVLDDPQYDYYMHSSTFYPRFFVDKNVNIVTEASAKVTVSGTATSFGEDATAAVTVELWLKGASTAAKTTTVTGNSASYSIEGVEAGTYTLKVMKKNHVTREYTLTVGSDNVTQNVEIYLKGDLNGDGEIKNVDSVMVLRHIKNVKTLTGYELICADLNGDGEIKNADSLQILRHIKEVNLLW